MKGQRMNREPAPSFACSCTACSGFLFIAGIAALTGLLELFRLADWGHGILRAFMLAALGALMFVLCHAGSRMAMSTSAAGKTRIVLTAVAVLALFIGVLTIVASIRRTVGGSEILLDQGQNSYRALRLMEQGIDPYGRKTMLDPIEYEAVRKRIMRSSPCLVSPVGDYRAELARYWRTLDVTRAKERLFLVIRDDPACEQWSIPAESLGYKYGPVLLLGYWPFVKTWDKTGIYVNHLVVLALFVALLLAFSLRRYDRSTGFFLLPVVMLLAPSPVRHNVLYYSASDLLPTAAAVLATLCCMEKRFTAGAVLLAISIGSKPLPGVLYLPLMTGAWPRHWLLLVGLGLLIYAPVFLWDFKGAMNNLVLFNMLRGTD
jgi:hypothetical protein